MQTNNAVLGYPKNRQSHWNDHIVALSFFEKENIVYVSDTKYLLPQKAIKILLRKETFKGWTNNMIW